MVDRRSSSGSTISTVLGSTPKLSTSLHPLRHRSDRPFELVDDDHNQAVLRKYYATVLQVGIARTRVVHGKVSNDRSGELNHCEEAAPVRCGLFNRLRSPPRRWAGAGGA
ncbi:MAG: hypothetical protein MZV70_35190 [Desulfobacterales bacterium]|nr:hypothetical protein [Desulfobacterales bacterium]